ncbi:hypothetical protein V1525DRAFT_88833 [Lipomyces kononenkoae]|uniref:Uncharacterized protein n=1 Tax=Lipomyces kononenkoae TaxID=34357 RepID=A0ACC3SQX6_LIPKO
MYSAKLAFALLLFLVVIDTAFHRPTFTLYSTVILAHLSMFYAVAIPRRPRKIVKPDRFQEFALLERIKINHNVAIYRFALPHQSDILGIPSGQHISVMATVDGNEAVRSYTPISTDDNRGYFDLLVKSYPQGRVSTFIARLEVGQTIRVRGPKGHMIYKKGLARAIGMIAGGTGITPMLSIIRAVLNNPSDRTKISLIYANVKENDILLRDKLDDLATKHSKIFKVHYVLSNPDEGWQGSSGFVTLDMIKMWLPCPGKDIKILLCGPPPMMTAMAQLTNEIGYGKSRYPSKPDDVVFLF